MTYAMRYRVGESWSGGVRGAFCVKVATPIESGWTIAVEFDKRLSNLDAQNAGRVAAVDASNRFWLIENAVWNRVIPPGDLEVDIVGGFTDGGRTPRLVAATFRSGDGATVAAERPRPAVPRDPGSVSGRTVESAPERNSDCRE